MQTKAFVRDATGLVREYSGLDTLLVASALVFALAYTTTQFAWFYGNTGGADLTSSLLLATVPFIFLMITYWVIGIVMPRTGNDYVWTGRIFHPAIGFVWSITYVFAISFAGYVGAGLGEFSYAASIAMTVLGLTSNATGLASLGTFLGGQVGAFELGILLILIFGAFAIFGSRMIKGLLYVSWTSAIIGTILMWYILGSVTTATFASNWNTLLVPSFGSNATYQALEATGLAGGYTAAPPGFASIVTALPLASLFLFGGNYANAFVGEIKNVRKSIPIALFLSLIFGVIWWSITATLTLNAVGANWMAAVGYAFDNGLHNYALPFPPSQPLMLAVAAYPNTGLIYLMMATFLLGSLGAVFCYFWIPTKYLFAWAFDRVIPSKFADVNERLHTPVVSIIAMMVVSVVMLGGYYFLGWASAFTLGTVLWGFSFVVPSLALVAFPYMKKDLFEQAPGFVKTKIASIPVMSIVGLISAISFAGIAYIAYITPADVVPTTLGFEITAMIVVVAFAIYFASWSYHKRQGLDISIALKQIPPE